MKIINLVLAVLTIVLMACNYSASDKKEGSMAPPKATTVEAAAEAVTEIKTTVSLKEIVDGYLQMKNAFTKDNSKDAATAGNNMVKAFTNFNKSELTAEQAKIYNDIEDDAREHAEHIGSNDGKIKHQREHFDMLSKDIYQLVKTFGSEQKLYYDHCPMFNDGKGADWVSETKEIKNPYYGKSMPTCGSLKEEIK